MPELPEVETIRSSLQGNIGSSISDIEIFRPEVVRQREYEVEMIYGQSLIQIMRRGKYLDFRLENRLHLVVHLGMTGRLYMMEEDIPVSQPHVHVIIHLNNRRKIIYQDPRRFGGVWLIENIDVFFAHLGKEPLSRQFTARYLADITANRKIAIKTLILNQNLIAGIGNIYADEALFAAGIRPDRPAGSLTLEEIKRLCQAIKKVLNNSIKQRGTTFRDYRDGYNQKGGFQNFLKAYGRTGQPCLKCGELLVKEIVGGRSSHFCRKCQR